MKCNFLIALLSLKGRVNVKNDLLMNDFTSLKNNIHRNCGCVVTTNMADKKTKTLPTIVNVLYYKHLSIKYENVTIKQEHIVITDEYIPIEYGHVSTK